MTHNMGIPIMAKNTLNLTMEVNTEWLKMETIHKIQWVDDYLQNIHKVIQGLRLTDLGIEQFQHEQ